MRALALLLAVVMGLSLTPGAALADATGKALGVDQDAKAETKAGTKELVVGPNSSLVIEDYLLREDGSGGKLAVNALSGTFRFITGGAPKDRYLIETPTGTIGVRGTALDIKGDGSHFTTILYHGSIVICNKAGECVTLDDVCDIGMVNLSEADILGNSTTMTEAEREQMRAMFPWADSEGDLLGQFRVAQARECFNRQVTPTVQDPVSTEGGPPPKGEGGRSTQ